MRRLVLVVVIVSILVDVASVKSSAPKHLEATGHRISGKRGKRSSNGGDSRSGRRSVDHRDGVGGRVTLQKRNQRGGDIDPNEKVLKCPTC